MDEGRPLEEWLTAKVGRSRCCSVCGDSDCRTVEYEGTEFESIPENLILKATLIAAAQMLEPNDRSIPRKGQNNSSKYCDDIE